jgi:cytochrome c oxidase assembly protein subunit 11
MTKRRDRRLTLAGGGRNAVLAAGLVGVVLGMLGLSFAAVPLYSLFCRTTGYGGTTQRAQQVSAAILDRKMRVAFNADVNQDMPWGFKPETQQITIKVGEPALIKYHAENRSGEPIVGTAVYNVTPLKAGRYFTHVQCFCFTEQRLEPGQAVDLPVYFYVDPAIASDHNMDDVDTITLSYTFFRAKSDSLDEAITKLNQDIDRSRGTAGNTTPGTPSVAGATAARPVN